LPLIAPTLNSYRTDLIRLALKHFFGQVIDDEAAAAGEGLNEVAGRLMPLQGQRGQLQTGDPAFGARFQRGDVFRREVEAHDLGEKSGGFGRGKPQIRGAQFGQFVTRPQPRQRQRGILPGGDDQAHRGGQVCEQKGEGLAHRFVVNHVVVIKDEDEIVRERADFVDQRR
jgi:hypothetical protein